MIEITDRVLSIPTEQRVICMAGDNLTNSMVFHLTGSDEKTGKPYADYDYKLDMQTQYRKNIIDLDKTVDENGVTLTWNIRSEDVDVGRLSIQIRAFDSTDEIWCTNQAGNLYVSESIISDGAFTDTQISEFYTIEGNVTNAKNDTISAKDIAVQKAEDAKVSAANAKVSEDNSAANAAAAKTSEDNAKLSEINSKESESNSKESETTASQAMSDLLNMLGNDVATLTNGKLTPEQIPSIAITDTYVADSQSAMLDLNAQTGDVCIRTDESKTYILQGSDPKVFENWQRLQSPTNYADEAGHAVTADTANNANMINNHRIVVMTQEQYETAVKDPNTVYLVG